MRVYYNEIDPYACDWLKNLIRDGLIPDGDIDERDIKEVTPDDLRGYTHCHFFAGIGGWAYAANLAGWPADRPLWTGSCPCQPFSVAGRRKGSADARHLWPEFSRLIGECHPPTVVGEQVASKDGREWLAGVFADLERVGYAVAGADLCAAGLGAPHTRQRLWWVADTDPERRGGFDPLLQRAGQPGRRPSYCFEVAKGSEDSRLADADNGREQRGFACKPPEGAGETGAGTYTESGRRGSDSRLGDSDDSGSQGRRQHPGEHAGQLSPWAASLDNRIPCLDGKSRRIEPGLEPLVDGVPFRLVDGRTVKKASRKEILKGLGNAIVPDLGAEWLSAVMQVTFK